MRLRGILGGETHIIDTDVVSLKAFEYFSKCISNNLWKIN